jgi:hypothetical protein
MAAMDEFPVSQMNLADFQETCTVLLQQLNVNTEVTSVSDIVRILTPDSSPRRFFVCNQRCWWIEDEFFHKIVQPTDYNTIKDLKHELDRNLRKQIANSQFNLWIALGKLTDVVHSSM